jgi:hypothetical protein
LLAPSTIRTQSSSTTHRGAASVSSDPDDDGRDAVAGSALVGLFRAAASTRTTSVRTPCIAYYRYEHAEPAAVGRLDRIIRRTRTPEVVDK